MEIEHPVEILLVEDNPKDVELTLYTLREHNLSNSIFVASDGEEALDYIFSRKKHAQRAPKQHPKVVLLDLKLPKIDGIEVLREIKSNPQTQAIPVVVLTSSQEEKDLVTAYQLGVNSYIVKPIDFEQLKRCCH